MFEVCATGPRQERIVIQLLLGNMELFPCGLSVFASVGVCLWSDNLGAPVGNGISGFALGMS